MLYFCKLNAVVSSIKAPVLLKLLIPSNQQSVNMLLLQIWLIRSVLKCLYEQHLSTAHLLL